MNKIKKIVYIVVIVLIIFISLNPFIGGIRKGFEIIEYGMKNFTKYFVSYFNNSYGKDLCTYLTNESLVLFAGGYLLYKLTGKKED